MVPTILQPFSFTLYKSYTCPLIQTFCASPNSFHLRADCSLCNTTLKPLTTKIQCYTAVLIYSTCKQIKTSSCSSSYSRYYELVYLSVCVLVVFSGRALTVVLQKNIIITNEHILSSRRMPGHIRKFNRLEPHSSHDLVFKIWRNNKTEATFGVFCL